jgi:IS5 family transposase
MTQDHQIHLADQLFSPAKRQTRSAKFLRKIDGVIDWAPLVELVEQLDKTSPQAGGRPRLPALVMIKSLFLQQFYGLSDPQLEEHLNDRLSFQEFTGLSLSRKAPDFTSFWTFKEELKGAGLEKKLFEQVNEQLDAKGLIIRKGTMVDATISESAGRPLSNDKREKLEKTPSEQIDTEAQSTKKRGRWYYGYKGHIGVDVESKLIRRCAYTPANVHDSQLIDQLRCGDEQSLFGDKAYSKDSLKREARKDGWYYGIHEKARRGRPLSNTQKHKNRQRSRVRAAVEHPFGWMKSQAGNAIARAKTTARNAVGFHFSCMCWNLKQASVLLAKAS